MNLGYIENGDKVLVIDEKGNKLERENTEYIHDILLYENSLEKINKDSKRYIEKLKNKTFNYYMLCHKKNAIIISGIILSISSLLFLIGSNFNYLSEFLITIFSASSSVVIVATIAGNNKIKKIKKRLKELEYILETTKKEKESLENKLSELVKKSKDIDKENMNKKDNNRINNINENKNLEINIMNIITPNATVSKKDKIQINNRHTDDEFLINRTIINNKNNNKNDAKKINNDQMDEKFVINVTEINVKNKKDNPKTLKKVRK